VPEVLLALLERPYGNEQLARSRAKPLKGGQDRRRASGQAGYVAGDTSPLRTHQTRTRPVLGHRPWCHRNHVLAAGGPALGLILHIPTTESKGHR
jgi:hypothetical protein